MIDLRSDTCSTPTRAMRRAMAEARVGDDVYGDDPTVLELEARVAALLGKEDAVYTVTGTLSNQIALRAHCEPGDQVLVEASAHILLSESGSAAALSGLTLRQIPGRNGTFGPELVGALLPIPHAHNPQSLLSPIRLLCVENTHNMAGGTVWDIDDIETLTAFGRERGLATHLDGARLWNACVRSGRTPSAYARHFDSVNVCFSKGLGAPIGSALAGSRDFVDRARRFKQAFGGGFRQAGVIAAGALHALEHHRERLAEDHENAGRFARQLSEMQGVELDLRSVQTNIVRFRVTTMPAGTFVDRCREAGVYMLPGGTHGVRAVFHIDITAALTDRALDVIRSVLSA